MELELRVVGSSSPGFRVWGVFRCRWNPILADLGYWVFDLGITAWKRRVAVVRDLVLSKRKSRARASFRRVAL
eukprot:scaffold2627_cov122-Skeletonema_marinoi.AAC.3